jgi:hypothetical protein
MQKSRTGERMLEKMRPRVVGMALCAAIAVLATFLGRRFEVVG